MPAGRAALDILRRAYTVDVFVWPAMKGGPRFPATWDGSVDATAAAITPGCHIAALGGAGSSVFGAVARKPGQVKSVVLEGLLLPAATLRALGLPELADATASTTSIERGWSKQIFRLIMPATQEDEIDRVAAILETDVDWPRLTTSARSYNDLDLTQEHLRLTAPTLFIEGALPIPGYSAVRDFMAEVAPQTIFKEVDLWPQHADMVEAGRQIATVIAGFIEEVERSAPSLGASP